VTRNGGLTSYLAERAQEATGRRARRSRPTLSAEQPDAAEACGRDPEAVRDFLGQFVSLMVQTGLPRMAARVFACLVTTDSGSLTAAELVARLRVSPASVSKAIGYLEGLDLVRRERDFRRRERYTIDEDLWLRSWRTDTQRHVKWADTARLGAEIFGAATPAGARFDDMSRFFTKLAGDMTAGPLTAAAVSDALTVLAALAFTGAPLSVEQLAAALDWTRDRVTSALQDVEQYPGIADPVTFARVDGDAYTMTIREDRLSTAQRQSLLSFSRRF
jgi:DNA-binding transcriptional regulator GbsR (MarR family)